MKVKTLIEELSKVNPNFDVMISVGRKGERDLIEKVGNIKCLNPSRFPDSGFVELETCNPIDWYYSSKKDVNNVKSPCATCGVSHKPSCCGCKEYFEWRDNNG